MAMTDKDYYEILGVSSDATTEEIRHAFQQKARTLHPDVNKEPDAEERFKEVSEAYAVLSDPDNRKRYDAMRAGNPFAGYTTTTGGASASAGDPFGGWGFPFGGAYAPRRTSRAYRPRPGKDFVIDIELDAEKAATGTSRGVTFQRFVTCDVCGGKGSKESATRTCPMCDGTGRVTLDFGDLLMGFGAMNFTCPECEGSGEVISEPCENCGGSGRVLSADEIVVDIPAKSHDGDVVRVEGKGNAGTNGERAGDFVARIVVPSERLSRASAQGFRLLGFALPFILLGLVTRSPMMAIMMVLPIVFGGMLVVRSGLGGHSRGWWRNAFNMFMAGFSNALVYALFMFAFISCSSGIGVRGYRG